MDGFLQKMDLAVFLALAAGRTKVGEIAAHAGHSEFRVREALKRLLAEGVAERVDYRTWALGQEGHAQMASMWIGYVELFAGRAEAHALIVSTIREAHRMIASDVGRETEAHEMCVSSAQNDRSGPPLMHVNGHAWMDDADSVQNRLADSSRNLQQDRLRNTLADSDESAGNPLRDPSRNTSAGSDECAGSSMDSLRNSVEQLQEALLEIGFDQPERWLQKESVSWELAAQWLAYVNGNGGIRNKAGFIRRQVEAGERPNLLKARRKGIPAEYEDIIVR